MVFIGYFLRKLGSLENSMKKSTKKVSNNKKRYLRIKKFSKIKLTKAS